MEEQAGPNPPGVERAGRRYWTDHSCWQETPHELQREARALISEVQVVCVSGHPCGRGVGQETQAEAS